MPIQLSEIQKAIRRTGAKWVAGETAISRLAPKLRAKLVSPVKLVPVAPTHPIEMPLPLPPPAVLDWTNIGGEDYVTPVKMQEGYSCTVWSSTAGLESSVLKSGLVSTAVGIDLAEEATLVSPESGLPNLDTISAFLKDTGLPTQDWFPGNPPTGITGWRDHTYRITGWGGYTPTSINDVKALIVHYGPVITALNVTESFLDYYQGGIWSNSTNEATIGGHEVLVVGYDDSNQCFKVKNSWGKDWGESRSGVHTPGDNGFFRIAYSEFQRSPVGFAGNICAYWGAVGPDIPPGVWPNGKKINTSDIAPAAPSACVFNNKLYLFWRGARDESMWYSASSDGSSWPQGKKINASDIAPGAPTACVFNNKLYLFWKGARDESMWYSASSIGSSWPKGKMINASDIALGTPSACIAFDKLYLFWRGTRDESMWYSASSSGSSWPQGNKINSFDIAPGAPSTCCVLYNKIYLFWKGALDESMWYGASTDGMTWSQGKKINASDIAPGIPSACAFNHNYYLFWRGARDESVWYSAL